MLFGRVMLFWYVVVFRLVVFWGGSLVCLLIVCRSHAMNVVGMWCGEVQEAKEHDECVVEEFFEVVTDENELPSGSEMSDGSDGSGQPNNCLFACRVPEPYLALSAGPAMRPEKWCVMLFGVSK